MIMISVLFSNKKYLERYNQKIPKTWDQLIDTSMYILEQERNSGNEELRGYAPLFPSK